MNEPTPKMRQIAARFYPRMSPAEPHRSAARAYAEGMLKARQMVLAEFYPDKDATDAIKGVFDA